MTPSNPITFCISTFNNLEYLKLAIESVRKNSYFHNAPFIVHAENCTDGTNEWLTREACNRYNLRAYIEKNEIPIGIGGGMNFCASKVETEYIMFLHSDFYVSKYWDLAALNVIKKYPDKKLWVSSYRIQPNIFNETSRPGTYIVEEDLFGSYWYDFKAAYFEDVADDFKDLNVGIEIRKGEGVSGLISKKNWDDIGGNDPIFAPASWEDMDLFLRMQQAGYDFILTSNSVVWHFGARGSHRLEENGGKTCQRQQDAERINMQKWLNKWGKLPVFDSNGFIKQW